ncbi:MAG: hypothetical protein Q9182_006144 [Xanthomendoza sp. 2 TL-2023]
MKKLSQTSLSPHGSVIRVSAALELRMARHCPSKSSSNCRSHLISRSSLSRQEVLEVCGKALRKQGDIVEAIYQNGKRERRCHEREIQEAQLIKELNKTKAKILQRLQNKREKLERDQHGQDPNQIRQEREIPPKEEEVQEAESFMQLEGISDGGQILST